MKRCRAKPRTSGNYLWKGRLSVTTATRRRRRPGEGALRKRDYVTRELGLRRLIRTLTIIRCGMKVARRKAAPQAWENPQEFFKQTRPILKHPPPGVYSCAECQAEKANLWRTGKEDSRYLCNK